MIADKPQYVCMSCQVIIMGRMSQCKNA